MSRLGIRKIISHYINSNVRHLMHRTPSPLDGFLQTRRAESSGTASQPAVIAKVPATQKLDYPMPELKSSATKHFVLGQNQPSANYYASVRHGKQPTMHMRLNDLEESKKPELLTYLGGEGKLCSICGHEVIYQGNNTNGVCSTCNTKIQEALYKFNKQQATTMSNCARRRQQEEQYSRELAHQQLQQQQQQQQQQQERSDREKAGQTAQPFSIIVLQDCNNSLIDQLTAALNASCQQDNSTNGSYVPNTNSSDNCNCFCGGCTMGSCNSLNYDDSTMATTGYQSDQSRYEKDTKDKKNITVSIPPPDNCNPCNPCNPCTTCTCNCQACRLGFENTLKLPMLMAKALEIFVLNNTPAPKKPAGKASGKAAKGKKLTLDAKASSSSVRRKDKFRVPQAGPKARKGSAGPMSSCSPACKGDKSCPGPRVSQTALQSKDQSAAKRRTVANSQSREFAKPKTQLGKKPSTLSQKSRDSCKLQECEKCREREKKLKKRKKKKPPGGAQNEKMFYLPQSYGGPCQYRNGPCLKFCRATCSVPPKLCCGCYNCARFTGGSPISKSTGRAGQMATKGIGFDFARPRLHNVGAGDQTRCGNCPRGYMGCSSCAGCSNGVGFERSPTTPRQLIKPLAHFRHGVGPYAANLMVPRFGDNVRRRLVRTAAGVTLHEVHRGEQEEQAPKQQQQQPPQQPPQLPPQSPTQPQLPAPFQPRSHSQPRPQSQSQSQSQPQSMPKSTQDSNYPHQLWR